jgi:hypothetical protein
VDSLADSLGPGSGCFVGAGAGSAGSLGTGAGVEDGGGVEGGGVLGDGGGVEGGSLGGVLGGVLGRGRGGGRGGGGGGARGGGLGRGVDGGVGCPPVAGGTGCGRLTPGAGMGSDPRPGPGQNGRPTPFGEAGGGVGDMPVTCPNGTEPEISGAVLVPVGAPERVAIAWPLPPLPGTNAARSPVLWPSAEGNATSTPAAAARAAASPAASTARFFRLPAGPVVRVR